VANYFGGTYTEIRQSGKYNQYLNFDIFFVTPILKDTSQRINDIPKYWYGVKFKEQISNKISNEEKEKKYQAFYDECIEKMNKYEFHSLYHFERKPNGPRSDHSKGCADH
jgi:rhomboid protease GluP